MNVLHTQLWEGHQKSFKVLLGIEVCEWLESSPIQRVPCLHHVFLQFDFWPSRTDLATLARSDTALIAMLQAAASLPLPLPLPFALPFVPAPGVLFLVLPWPYLTGKQGHMQVARTIQINVDVHMQGQIKMARTT